MTSQFEHSTIHSLPTTVHFDLFWGRPWSPWSPCMASRPRPLWPTPWRGWCPRTWRPSCLLLLSSTPSPATLHRQQPGQKLLWLAGWWAGGWVVWSVGFSSLWTKWSLTFSEGFIFYILKLNELILKINIEFSGLILKTFKRKNCKIRLSIPSDEFYISFLPLTAFMGSQLLMGSPSLMELVQMTLKLETFASLAKW